MGHSAPKMCHTQEIAFEPTHDEWRPIDEWSEDLTKHQDCEPPANCRLCCRPGESHVEEVLVVHHEALQKVDFLLHHDELTSCEAPAVPECVTAVRRAKILKRLLSQQRSRGQQDGGEDSTSCREVAGVSTLPQTERGGPPQPCQEDSDPSEEEDEGEHSNMQPPDGFYHSCEKSSDLERRLRDGLEMWTLSRGRDKEILQEAVLMQKLEWDAAVLRVTGTRFQASFPLANITCVELTTSVESAAGVSEEHNSQLAIGELREERGVYVYLTASKRDQKAGEGAFHFAFQNAQDAQGFRSWMRTFYPSQLVSASDADPVPGTC